MSEPRTTMMTKLFHAETKTGERSQIAYVQSIPEFLTDRKSTRLNSSHIH